jgi:hypothetical protein
MGYHVSVVHHARAHTLTPHQQHSYFFLDPKRGEESDLAKYIEQCYTDKLDDHQHNHYPYMNEIAGPTSAFYIDVDKLQELENVSVHDIIKAVVKFLAANLVPANDDLPATVVFASLLFAACAGDVKSYHIHFPFITFRRDLLGKLAEAMINSDEFAAFKRPDGRSVIDLQVLTGGKLRMALCDGTDAFQPKNRPLRFSGLFDVRGHRVQEEDYGTIYADYSDLDKSLAKQLQYSSGKC